MIDTKDIRLGNLVLDKHGKPCRVSEIGKTGIKVEGGPGTYRQYAGEFSPIKITEELLPSIGFEKSTDNWVGDCQYERIWECDTFDIVWIGNCDCYRMVNRCGDPHYESIDSFQIHNVHQLQNLYYALTGKELKVNMELL